jgi:hypothetical protein
MQRKTNRPPTNRSHRFSPFNQGGVPTIACFNSAKTALNVDLDQLIAALQVYVDKYVAPVWGTPAKLVRTKSFRKYDWALAFLDDADTEDKKLMAYHDLTPAGLPLAKVFVRTLRDRGGSLSAAASHELVEMLVDPATNMMTTGPDRHAIYAYESADPVEDLTFDINGFAMTNFVYPSYFERFHKPGAVQFDAMKRIGRPFEIAKGGYQIIYKRGKWSQLFSSSAKRREFAAEDRRGHRSETRRKAARSRAR